MKVNPFIAVAIPLGMILVSMLAYLSMPGPVADGDSPSHPRSALSRELVRHANSEGELDAGQPILPESAPAAETLLQKYAESESQRQKEIADERLPVFVPPPLVLLEAGSDMGLNDAQAGKLKQLRQSFIDGLSKLGKDPASPEYLEYWIREQERLDDQLRLHLGEEIFLKFSAGALAALHAERANRK